MIVKHGDTHTIELVVESGSAPVNLTGASVRLLARRIPDGTVETLVASVTDALAGKVTHTLTGNLAVGAYEVELEVTAGGSITTAPSVGYFTLEVTRDLG